MVRVKKGIRYSKYALILLAATFIGWLWPHKQGKITTLTPSIPVAHADYYDSPTGGDDGGDCDGDGDCDS